MQIIGQLAKDKVVETMVASIAHTDLTDDLQDLAQMVYEALLDTDAQKIERMYQARQIRYYIAKIITNQYRTSNSPWHNAFRKHKGMPLTMVK